MPKVTMPFGTPDWGWVWSPVTAFQVDSEATLPSFSILASPWVKDTTGLRTRQSCNEPGLVYNKISELVQLKESATFQVIILGDERPLPSMPELDSKCLGTSLWRIPSESTWKAVTVLHPFLALCYKMHLYLYRCSHLGRFLELEMVNKAIYYF